MSATTWNLFGEQPDEGEVANPGREEDFDARRP